MKITKCPQKKGCWDYGNCDNCNIGKYIIRQDKRIKKLKEKIAELEAKEKTDGC